MLGALLIRTDHTSRTASDVMAGLSYSCFKSEVDEWYFAFTLRTVGSLPVDSAKQLYEVEKCFSPRVEPAGVAQPGKEAVWIV